MPMICNFCHEMYLGIACPHCAPRVAACGVAESVCPHRHTVVEMRDTRRFVGPGEVDGDVHEVVTCTDCGEELV